MSPQETWRERRARFWAAVGAAIEGRLQTWAAAGARRFPRFFAAAENALGLSTADMLRPGEAGADRVLAGAVLALAAFGTVMVFSAGAVFAAKKYGDAFYFLKRQLVYLALGLAAMTVAVRTDYTIYRRFAYPLLFASILALAAVLKIGGRAGGAIRWFRLGPLSFQPSELAKFALCAYLATLLARKAEKVRVFSVGFLPPLVVTGVMMLLLLKQPDLGTAVIFGVVALSLLFVAGTRTSYIVVALLVAAPAGWKFIVSTPFRLRRMLAFLDPWAFRRDVGYQITESLMSIGSGGLTGAGLGDGRQKLFFLPEAHTDFILSIIGEELGLIGVLAVLGGFAVFVWRGLRASYRARDVFGTYLAFGITAMFGLQALTNIGVVLGSLPAKGLTLPFISYGGSSLILSLFMAGVLVNISARNPEPKRGLGLPTGKRGKAKNRRRERGPRLVVEIPRRRPRPSAPELTPAEAEVAAGLEEGPLMGPEDTDPGASAEGEAESAAEPARAAEGASEAEPGDAAEPSSVADTAGAPVARETDEVTAPHSVAGALLAAAEARLAEEARRSEPEGDDADVKPEPAPRQTVNRLGAQDRTRPAAAALPAIVVGGPEEET